MISTKVRIILIHTSFSMVFLPLQKQVRPPWQIEARAREIYWHKTGGRLLYRLWVIRNWTVRSYHLVHIRKESPWSWNGNLQTRLSPDSPLHRRHLSWLPRHCRTFDHWFWRSASADWWCSVELLQYRPELHVEPDSTAANCLHSSCRDSHTLRNFHFSFL